MEPDSQQTAKQMRLRYAGSCSVCGGDLPAGVKAVYDRSSKTVRCLVCVTEVGAAGEPVVLNFADSAIAPSPDPTPSPEQATGTAGSSARREYERRKARRENRIRTDHPRLSGVLLALFDEPQSTRAWQQGAIGEERLGGRLDQLGEAGVATLHDRRIPRSRANIDHIVVAASGVWVVDAKRYKGRPALRVEGGILRPRVERLLVGRRDCTKLVDGVLKQVELVREALARADITVPVTGVLAFVDADWPLIGGSFTTRGVHVVWPKRLQKLLLAPGQPEDMPAIRQVIAEHFPPA